MKHTWIINSFRMDIGYELLIHFVRNTFARNSFVRGSFVRTVAKHYFRRNYEKSLPQKIQRLLSFIQVRNENFSFVTLNTQRYFFFLRKSKKSFVPSTIDNVLIYKQHFNLKKT